MNEIEKNALSAVSVSLHGGEYSSGADASALFHELDIHSVGFFSDSVLKQIIGTENEELLKRRRALSGVNLRKGMLIMREIRDITAVCAENGIKPVILKGASSAYYYPRPMLRAWGDIDIIVPPDETEKARQLLEVLGYTEESDSVRHIGYRKNGIEAELHRCFGMGETAIDDEVEKIISEGLKNPVLKQISGAEFYSLPPLECGISLLEHVRHHLKSGVGLRQVCDWMMFAEGNTDTVKSEDFREAAERCGLWNLAVYLTDICRKYLGSSVSSPGETDAKYAEELCEYILSSGNFGRKQLSAGENNETGAVYEYMKAPLEYFNKISVERCPAAKKYRILLPYAWIKQFFHIIASMIKRRYGFGRMKKDIIRTEHESELFDNIGVRF